MTGPLPTTVVGESDLTIERSAVVSGVIVSVSTSGVIFPPPLTVATFSTDPAASSGAYSFTVTT